jgi:penicillin amidase
MTPDSVPALIYEIWLSRLPGELFVANFASRPAVEVVLKKLEAGGGGFALRQSLRDTISYIETALGSDINRWQYSRLTATFFRHPLNVQQWNRGPFFRAGDSNTINAGGGGGAMAGAGASYRQIIDLADWDKSVMTNAPGESGDPDSPHYSDLIAGWLNGTYHPLAFSRKAVEEAATERITLTK